MTSTERNVEDCKNIGTNIKSDSRIIIGLKKAMFKLRILNLTDFRLIKLVKDYYLQRNHDQSKDRDAKTC